jgi:hypothetical protein
MKQHHRRPNLLCSGCAFRQIWYADATFTAAADVDSPPQTLAFSLGAGAPAGAAIDASSGQFIRTPIVAPNTNIVNLIVTDNGIPFLSATQAFTITVLLPPQISGINVGGNQLVFTWSTAAGQNYQIEYKNDLASSSWTSLGGPINGTGSSISFTNDLTTAQRFFRLRILP